LSETSFYSFSKINFRKLREDKNQLNFALNEPPKKLRLGIN
jgi:hypothetical protein